ncbi:MAG TPA: hypothetical protein VFE82_05655 [Ramlibacter sp.]|jgi:ElaB/YqjD/DUF883 family membrane-anchored ribosome-binding protein|uniref:hypothetical protein n=1 Tax=Ramlibacter sp. TaxID=1917967 RepID=UPI002D420DA1|nr:hypothetical protein [Ramlibacter sp.]HZY17947.1 hypothetical protein [Ramlibacter sp.]
MNSETSESPFPTSSTMDGGASGGTGADAGRVQRMAQAAHQAVDRLEQTLGSSSEKMMGWQQEYGDMAREQVRTNPLAAVGVAFAVGIVFSKLFMR